MPFALIIVGVVLLVASARNTQSQLYTLLAGDFTGQDNFIFWLVSILIIGAVGYIPKLKPLSVAFMTLVIVVLFLKRGNAQGVGGGFFSQFTSAIATTQTATPTIAASSGSSTNPSSSLLGQASSLLGAFGGVSASNPGPLSGATLGNQTVADQPIPTFNNPTLPSPVQIAV